MGKVFFVVSLPRSGSTLALHILSKFSKVKVSDEPWFLLDMLASNEWKSAKYDNRLATAAFKNYRIQSPHIDFEEAKKNYIKALYGLNGLGDDTVVVDKTPRYYFILNEIDDLDIGEIILLVRPLPEVFRSIYFTWGNRNIHRWMNDVDITLGPRLLKKFTERGEYKNVTIFSYDNIVSGDFEKWLKGRGDLGEFHSISNYLPGSFGDPRFGKPLRGEVKEFYNTPYRRFIYNRLVSLNNAYLDERVKLDEVSLFFGYKWNFRQIMRDFVTFRSFIKQVFKYVTVKIRAAIR